ncbi:protein DpdD [Bacillus sp. V59.32b]|uniref:protein DpdD n=1 Tax=Bacillus sp. V59.32b TaxID=1758642 RepID=UPI000E3C9C3B|nr:protein DpdD [Bacillus sp. V59.32b]RFU70014.1 hypothetical protein D0463_00635 [Bacillus sp. V59.32b]
MNTSRIEFLRFLLKMSEADYKSKEINGQFFVDQSIFQEMVNRLTEGLTAILPFQNKGETVWLCLQSDEQTLTFDYSSLKKFISPYNIDDVVLKRMFVRDTSELGRLGSDLFPNGYYMFKTSNADVNKIWELLKLWLIVLNRKPTIKWQESVINAYTLRNKFRNHLGMMEWAEAEQTLNVIRDGHYVSDENFLFLYVELLSAQSKWKDIWYWKEFETLSGLQRLPKEVKEAMLSAFYFVNLADDEVNNDFEKSFQKFTANRFRLSTLLHSHLGIMGDHIYRIFAYQSTFEQNLEKLYFIKDQVRDDETLNLICYLETKFSENPVRVLPPSVSSEERAKQFLINRQYDDAYLALKDCDNSKEKVGMLSVLGFETGSSEIQNETYQLFLELPKAAQDSLSKDNKTKNYILFIKMTNEGIQKKARQEDIKYTWNHWFLKVLETDTESFDPLFEVLYDQEKLPLFIWSPSMVVELSNIVLEVALSTLDSKKTVVLNEGIIIFISELIRDKEFPRTIAADLYADSVELLLLHCNKNKINTNHLNRLFEGLLQINVVEIDKYWHWASQWYSITPMNIMIPNLLFTLELFCDYGQKLEDLSNVWNQWTSTLLNGISTLSDIEIIDWVKIGQIIGGEKFLINKVQDLVENEITEIEELELAPVTSIVIFTLRENAARRAAEQLVMRNPNLKIRINMDTHLTTQAKSLASSSDVVVLVTTAMKHALYYGITPYIKNEPVYPSSSGTSSIVVEIEKYFKSLVTI